MQSQVMNFKTPERFKGRTGIQIFVDRFYREGLPPEPREGRILKSWDNPIPNWEPDKNGVYQNNYFYGGNLKGITVKLDYIRENGFNLIYLSPIGWSETSHHYDPINQMEIDPWIGTWDDFKELCEEAHKRDILIVVDLVYNHIGVKSPMFQDAINNPYSPYHDWFEWDAQGKPIFWGGFDNMPQCNKYNSDYQDYTCKCSVCYIKMGADGIRYDLGENFPAVFMNKQRDAVKAVNSEVLLVNEAWGFDNHRENPQLDGRQVDSVMNYPLADAIIRWVRFGNDAHFRYNMGEILKYPAPAQDVLFNHLDTHDTPRAGTLLVSDGILQDPYRGACWDIEGPWRHPGWFDTYEFRRWELEHEDINMDEVFAKLSMASAIQYFMPGIPIVFAGTEVGVTGYKDPFNRKPYPWKNKNEQILKHYKKLGEFREKHKEFFSESGLVWIDVSYLNLRITRKNQYGKMTLYVFRDICSEKDAWGISIE